MTATLPAPASPRPPRAARAMFVGVIGVVIGGPSVACDRRPPPPPPAAVTTAPVVDGPAVDPRLARLEAARAAAAQAVTGRDLDGALRALDAVLPATPEGAALDEAEQRARCDRAAVLSRRAAVASDDKARERDLRAAVTDCPTEPVLHEALAGALLRRARGLGDDESTRAQRRALLEESLQAKPTAAAAVDLARVCEELDDLAAAAAAADVAVGLLPGDPRLVKLRDRLRRQLDIEGEFLSARHSHFVARFEGFAEERTAWGALDVLEQAWFSVGKELDLYPREPITVVIYTGEQYKAATTTPDWSAGAFDGKIRVREGLLAAERGTLEDTLVHEYVHAALHDGLPRGTTLPPWFNEGLAQHLEKTPRDARALVARFGRAPLPLLQRPFLGLTEKDARAAYATSLAMVRVLAERRGNWGLQQVIAALKEGRSFDDALRAAFAMTDAEVLAAVEEPSAPVE